MLLVPIVLFVWRNTKISIEKWKWLGKSRQALPLQYNAEQFSLCCSSCPLSGKYKHWDANPRIWRWLCAVPSETLPALYYKTRASDYELLVLVKHWKVFSGHMSGLLMWKCDLIHFTSFAPAPRKISRLNGLRGRVEIEWYILRIIINDLDIRVAQIVAAWQPNCKKMESEWENFLYQKLSHFVAKCLIWHFCRKCHKKPYIRAMTK